MYVRSLEGWAITVVLGGLERLCKQQTWGQASQHEGLGFAIFPKTFLPDTSNNNNNYQKPTYMSK